MANEATLIFELGPAIPFTVADGTGIEKGTHLTLSDPMTAAANSAIVLGPATAGIAAAEKIANNGVTKLGVFREGIFKVTASGSITAGDPLAAIGNFVYTAATNEENLIGTAFETATDGQTLLMELKPITAQLA